MKFRQRTEGGFFALPFRYFNKKEVGFRCGAPCLLQSIQQPPPVKLVTNIYKRLLKLWIMNNRKYLHSWFCIMMQLSPMNSCNASSDIVLRSIKGRRLSNWPTGSTLVLDECASSNQFATKRNWSSPPFCLIEGHWRRSFIWPKFNFISTVLGM